MSAVTTSHIGNWLETEYLTYGPESSGREALAAKLIAPRHKKRNSLDQVVQTKKRARHRFDLFMDGLTRRLETIDPAKLFGRGLNKFQKLKKHAEHQLRDSKVVQRLHRVTESLTRSYDNNKSLDIDELSTLAELSKDSLIETAARYFDRKTRGLIASCAKAIAA